MGRVDDAPLAVPRSVPFLERLSPPVRQQLTANSRRVRYPAASLAWEEGEPMQSAVLVSGFARVFISSAAGRQATVRYVHAGELMGATMVVAKEPFPASVQIVAESVVQYLDLGQFQQLLERSLEVSLALANNLAARYVHAVQAATILVFGTTVQKVAYDLLERACRQQLSTSRLMVTASQHDLADSINSSREVVSRAIRILRQHGIIATGVRSIVILDVRRLETTAWRGLTDLRPTA
jgi:CRP/FNR family cyclic AMP-dependent transcriptional regulator